MRPSHAVPWLLALTLVRLAVAATAGLAPDEAYYWVWSRAVQPGYLDHPPMVALWIRLGTALVGQTALGVRLLGPLSALVGSLLLADAAGRLFPGRGAGVRAAVLLNATLMMGAGAVTMTPDTPLLFFAVLALWAIVRAREGAGWWLAAGAAVGAALDSKYTGVLVGVAIPLWLVWTRQWRVLRSPWLWAGGAVAVAVFAPVLAWNAGHGWVSVAKQGGRAEVWAPARAAQFLGELVGGQVGLATPVIAALFAAGLWRAARGGERAALLLVALAGPGLLIFLEHALGDRVQANWLALLYPPLAILAAAYTAGWLRPAAAIGFAATALVYLQASLAPLPLPRRLDPTLVQLAGWDGLAQAADAQRRASGAQFLAAEEYGLAAELAWWTSPGAAVEAMGPRWQWFRLPPPASGPGLLLLRDRGEGTHPDQALWAEAEPDGTLIRQRDGVEAERFRVYRVTRRAGAVGATLPRPEPFPSRSARE